MLLAFWNEAWTAALANHLWQSIRVTGMAGLLLLSLRRFQHMAFQDLDKFNVSGGSMQELADLPQVSVLDHPVIDWTGITGRYDIRPDWTPDDSHFRGWGAIILHFAGGLNQLPPLSAAIRRQPGLQLETTMASVEVIVIDRIEKPAELD